jgi:hypothetical protein
MLILDIEEYLENLVTENKSQKPADDISKRRLGTPYAWTDVVVPVQWLGQVISKHCVVSLIHNLRVTLNVCF